MKKIYALNNELTISEAQQLGLSVPSLHAPGDRAARCA